ncbi:MAG: carboxypeptidase-like regulatory domain-containing protein, partial [Daejeonella sp.]
MKKLLPLILLAFFQFTVSAQTTRQVKGLVADSTGIKLSAVGIRLTSPTDTLTTITNSEGLFTFKNVKSSVFTIAATSVGFQSSVKKYLFKDDNTPITLPVIILNYENQLLNEVTVSGTPAVTIKEDTVEYRASDYELRENALAEDL